MSTSIKNTSGKQINIALPAGEIVYLGEPVFVGKLPTRFDEVLFPDGAIEWLLDSLRSSAEEKLEGGEKL